MNLLNKLTIKNLKLNKKRTVVTIIGIVLSVALLIAVSTMYASAIASLIRFETTQKGNFHTAFYDVPVEKLKDFENNRKLGSLYLTQGIGYAALEESQNEYKPYLYIKAFTKEAMENLSLKLIKGRLPKTEEEIVIPSHLETNGRVKYQVGDTLTLEVGTRVLADGTVLTQEDRFLPSDESSSERSETIQNTTTKTYKIVGLIERPANNIEDYSAPGYTLITLLDDTNLTGTVDIYARYTKEGVKDYFTVTAGILGIDAKAFKQYLSGDMLTSQEEQNSLYEELKKAKYRYMDNSYLVFLETNPFENSTVGSLGTAVVIVLVIIVLTSVFCIKNSFDISITEKTKQYGMLRSIGATKKQIKKNVFYEASILGMIGIPLGLLSGIVASYILVLISNYFLKDMITSGTFLLFRFSWIAFVVASVLGIVTIYFSAFRSARRASRISPIDSIRNSANITLKAKKLRTPKIIKKCFGIGGVISFKNQKRNKKKYRTTVISIVVSVFTFIALSSFMSLAFQEIDQEISVSDYNISFSVAPIDEELYAKVESVGNFSNIRDYAIYSSYYGEAEKPKYNPEYQKILQIEDEEEGRDVWVASVGEHQYQQYLKELGFNPEKMKNKAILLDTTSFSIYDEKKAEEIPYRMRIFDYQVGDKITVLMDEKEEKIEIGALSEEVPFSMKEKVRGNHSAYLIVSDEYMKEHDLLHHVMVYLDSKDANKTQDELEAYFDEIENFSVDNQEESVRMMRNLYTLIGIFLYGFIIVISLIGITNIFNTITTNMELRKQEFAMLKSIGMTTYEFNRMIYLETIFIGCKALFFGIPIGLGFSYLIYRSLGNTEYAYHPPLQAILLSIIAVFLLIAALMRYSMKKIQKQNTIETIRNENI